MEFDLIVVQRRRIPKLFVVVEPQSDRAGSALFFSLTIAALFFYSIPWVNKWLVTRHLFAVSGCSPSQKIEFGSKPAGL
jgi:hypothetical protein